VSGPGKGADAGAWQEALDALSEERPAAWFVDRALKSKAARKGVAAAIARPQGARIKAALVELVGEDASVEKLLRRAAGRDLDAQIRRNPIARNEGFDCAHCGATVSPAPGSSVRNHCPRCLHSLHVDGDVPGDRAADCGGVMRPVRAEQRDGGWRVEQACARCGHRRWNRLHPEWAIEPDRLDALPG
jgi:hypothetical protein